MTSVISDTNERRMVFVSGRAHPELADQVAQELGIEAGSRLDRVVREPNIERAISHGIRRDRGLGMSM